MLRGRWRSDVYYEADGGVMFIMRQMGGICSL